MNLRLANDHRLHSGRHTEEMGGRIAVAAHVTVPARFAAEPIRQHLPHRHGHFPIALDEVELRAVAGREQHALAGTGRIAYPRQHGEHLARRERKPLAHIERRAVMAHAKHDHGHSAIRSASCPRSTAMQNSASISVGDISRQRWASPPTIRRLRSALRSFTASP